MRTGHYNILSMYVCMYVCTLKLWIFFHEFLFRVNRMCEMMNEDSTTERHIGRRSNSADPAERSITDHHDCRRR